MVLFGRVIMLGLLYSVTCQDDYVGTRFSIRMIRNDKFGPNRMENGVA